MKLSEINTKLFSNVQLTDFGFRFLHQDNKLMKIENSKYPQYVYAIIVSCLHDGSININQHRAINLSNEQLNEIVRVANVLKGEL